jgi:hypothetical protein
MITSPTLIVGVFVVDDLEREARVEPLSDGAGVIAPLLETADGVVGMDAAVDLRRGGMMVGVVMR